MALETDARLDRIETDLRDLRAEVNDIRSGLGDFRTEMAKNFGDIKAGLTAIQAEMPHLATKAEVEKGKYALVVGAIALVASLASIASRFV